MPASRTEALRSGPLDSALDSHCILACGCTSRPSVSGKSEHRHKRADAPPLDWGNDTPGLSKPASCECQLFAWKWSRALVSGRQLIFQRTHPRRFARGTSFNRPPPQTLKPGSCRSAPSTARPSACRAETAGIRGRRWPCCLSSPRSRLGGPGDVPGQSLRHWNIQHGRCQRLRSTGPNAGTGSEAGHIGARHRTMWPCSCARLRFCRF